MISKRKEPRSVRSSAHIAVALARTRASRYSLCDPEIGSSSRLQSSLLPQCCPPSLRCGRRIARHASCPTPSGLAPTASTKPEPDTVLVQFNISAQEDKLQDANQKASRAAEQVRQLLRSNGLDPKGRAGRTVLRAAGVRLQESEAQTGRLSRGHQHQHQAERLLQSGADYARGSSDMQT